MKHIIAYIALFLSMAFISNIAKAETVSIEIVHTCLMKVKEQDAFRDVIYKIGKDNSDRYYVFDNNNKMLLSSDDIEFSKSLGKDTIIVSSIMTRQVLIRLTQCDKI